MDSKKENTTFSLRHHLELSSLCGLEKRMDSPTTHLDLGRGPLNRGQLDTVVAASIAYLLM